jgi:hypothetical protein
MGPLHGNFAWETLQCAQSCIRHSCVLKPDQVQRIVQPLHLESEIWILCKYDAAMAALPCLSMPDTVNPGRQLL